LTRSLGMCRGSPNQDDASKIALPLHVGNAHIFFTCGLLRYVPFFVMEAIDKPFPTRPEQKMDDTIELAQPQDWHVHTSSKTGRQFYVHKISGESKWEMPHDSFENRQWSYCIPACKGEVCLLHRDADKQEVLFEFLQRQFLQEMGGVVVAGAIVHIGCGREKEVLLLSNSLSKEIYFWDTNPDVIAKKKSIASQSNYFLGRRVFFEHVDLLDAGEGLPLHASAPLGKTLVVFSGDTAQCCWDTASHARRFLRKVGKLLDPKNGVALLLMPDAKTIVDNTAQGCTAFVRRDGEVIEAEGAHWPSNAPSRIVYGARYTHRAAGRLERIQWLVTRPTLEHAADAAGLSVASMCNAVTFLSWLGLGQAPLLSKNQRARQDRGELAWKGVMEKCGEQVSAHDWESMRFWAMAVLVPRRAENLSSMTLPPNDTIISSAKF
jgi:hypothetical protein